VAERETNVEFVCSAGFALFKLQDEGVLKSPEKLYKQFEKIESAKKLCVKLSKFHLVTRILPFNGHPVI
jgi:hypothetical protein